MNKKADVKLEMIFISAIMLGVVFVAGLSLYSEGLTKYNVDVDTSTTWGKIGYNAKEINQLQIDTRNKLQGGTVSDESAVDEMIKGAYTGTRTNPFSAIEIASNATMTLFQETQMVPDFWISFLLLVLATILVWSIIALIFRFRTGGG